MQCKMKSLDVRKLLRQRLQSGLQKNGLIDMFSFMAEIKDEYPLQCHDTVFQQTSASLGHEGTSEDAFSIAKGLSDPSMHASFLQVLTKIKGFLKSCRPTVEQIWERYKKKY